MGAVDPVAARLGFLEGTGFGTRLDVAEAYVIRAEARLAAGKLTGRFGAGRQAREALNAIGSSKSYRAPKLRARAQAVLNAEGVR